MATVSMGGGAPASSHSHASGIRCGRAACRRAFVPLAAHFTNMSRVIAGMVVGCGAGQLGVSHVMGSPLRAFVRSTRAHMCHKHGSGARGVPLGGVDGGSPPAGLGVEGGELAGSRAVVGACPMPPVASLKVYVAVIRWNTSPGRENLLRGYASYGTRWAAAGGKPIPANRYTTSLR